MDFTPEGLRKLFAEKSELKAKAEAAAKPARDKLDKLRAQMAPLEKEINALRETIKEKEAPLYTLSNELAAIARALGGKGISNEEAPKSDTK